VKMDPFIEAEEVAGHSVKHCCELFKVSKSAYYQRKQDQLSTRAISDTALMAKMIEIHTTSDGTYGAPRIHQELRAEGVVCGRRRVRRLMRRAGLEGRCKKRWRKTTIQDPATEAEALDLIRRLFRLMRSSTPATSATSPTSPPGRDGRTWPR
jgi:putative transposase